MEHTIYKRGDIELISYSNIDRSVWKEGDEEIWLQTVGNPSEIVQIMKKFRHKGLPEHVLEHIEKRLKGSLCTGNEWLWNKWKEYQYYDKFNIF